MFPPGIPISKRFFDLALTLPGLVIISPILLLLAVLVRLKLGRSGYSLPRSARGIEKNHSR